MGTSIEGTNKNTTSEIATGVDASTDVNSLLANVADLITRTKGLNDIHDDVGIVDTIVDAIKVVIDNLPDSGALNDLALILSEVAGLNGNAMRGTDSVPTNPMLDSENGSSFSAIPDMALNSTVAKEATLGAPAHTDIAGDIADLIARTKGLDDIHDDVSTVDAKVDVLEDLFLPKRVVKIVTFDGGAGSGAVGTVNLFTITGGVDISFEAFCVTLLTEAGATATIEVGIAGKTDYIIAQTNAVDIDADKIWHDATPDSTIELTSDVSKDVTIKGANIIATIGTQNITAGVIEFSIIYTPRTSDGIVEAA